MVQAEGGEGGGHGRDRPAGQGTGGKAEGMVVVGAADNHAWGPTASGSSNSRGAPHEEARQHDNMTGGAESVLPRDAA